MNCLAATTITCMPFSNMAVAINQPKLGFTPFSRAQRCSLQSLTHLDYYNFLGFNNETSLAHSLNQASEEDNIHRSFSTPCFSIASNLEEEYQTATKPRIEILGGHRAPTVRALVAEVTIAMVSGVEPLALPSGLGGAYLLRTRNGHNIAVAKPIDEEPLAFNNPKGFGGLMLGQPEVKRSIRVGETGIRELAAYLLDHQGFTGVPPTAFVKISHVSFHVSDTSSISNTPDKIASLQRFVDHDFDAGELGPSGFSVASIHRMGIFDVRVLNLDRHAGNMLVKKHDQDEGYNPVGTAELVPIDHGLCLPEWLDDPYFEWLHWPQASVPFTESELQYISDLDPSKDAELLRTELPSLRESSIRVLIVCTIFLKQAAASGLCLADIGQMMTREFCRGEENSSVLENLCAKAKASLVIVSDDDDGSNIQSDEESEMEAEIFQYDDESGDSSCDMDLPPLFQIHPDYQMSKPPMIPRLSLAKNSLASSFYGAMLSSPSQWTTDNDTSKDDNKNAQEDSKVGCITRSMSYPAQKCVNHESEGISFGDMTEDEWESFLECFEKLLPEVLETTKYKGLKQRLGSSCKF